mmetsp:Transcript_16948/g.21518  ORF Transcript_16948/g.21518 Transcript_16948/m.21518 type:complete len:83 (+) Transcript_16948:1212-1460(+)
MQRRHVANRNRYDSIVIDILAWLIQRVLLLPLLLFLFFLLSVIPKRRKETMCSVHYKKKHGQWRKEGNTLIDKIITITFRHF